MCTGLLHTWALVYPCVCVHVHVPECVHALECACAFWMRVHEHVSCLCILHPKSTWEFGKLCVCAHAQVCIHLCAWIGVSVGVSPPSPHQLLGTIPPQNAPQPGRSPGASFS